MAAPPLTFRRVLLLCLPALLVGLVVRVAFLYSIPEGYFGSDSNSYFDTAVSLWTQGKWDMGDKRAGFYPLFLLLTTVLPGSTAQATAVLQHAMGLVSLAGIGWVTGHFVRRPTLWIPVVTLLCAVLPQPLWFEHEMIADAMLLHVFILVVALAVPIERLRTERGLFWFLIAAAGLLALKPHGRPLWLGLMIAAVFIAGNPLRWARRNHIALAFSVFLIFTTGSSKQGSWLFLSSTLPLVPVEGKKNPAERAALRPLIEETHGYLADYPWRQGVYKKMLNNEKLPRWQGTAWEKLLDDDRRFSKVASSFAREAVLTHPIEFSRFVLMKFAIALSKVDEDVKLEPAVFWSLQGEHNDRRWVKDPAQMKLLYGHGEEEHRKMVEERLARPYLMKAGLFSYARQLNWFGINWPVGREFPYLFPTWFAAVGMLGIIHCLLPARARRSTLLLLPCFLYLGLVFTVGDSRARYLLPVEWIGILFGVFGVELLLDLAARCFRRRADVTQPQPAGAGA